MSFWDLEFSQKKMNFGSKTSWNFPKNRPQTLSQMGPSFRGGHVPFCCWILGYLKGVTQGFEQFISFYNTLTQNFHKNPKVKLYYFSTF